MSTTKLCPWKYLRQENIPLISVSVRSCITPPQSPSPAPQAGWHSDAIQGGERWEGLLYRPYGGEVRYLSSLSRSLSLSESPATMRFPHTRHRVWVSASPPRLSPFILNSDKERKRDVKGRGGGGLAKRGEKGGGWEGGIRVKEKQDEWKEKERHLGEERKKVERRGEMEKGRSDENMGD